jgi:Protein of unknown function (DUF4065)
MLTDATACGALRPGTGWLTAPRPGPRYGRTCRTLSLGEHEGERLSILSAHDVARELRQRLPYAGDVKIHKLAYYCQGWHVAWTGEPMFREAVEAWTNGPVVAHGSQLWAG